MKLNDLNEVINENTRVKIYLHYGYKNWNPYLKWDCKWKLVKEDYNKEDLLVDLIEPHEGYFLIDVHR